MMYIYRCRHETFCTAVCWSEAAACVLVRPDSRICCYWHSEERRQTNSLAKHESVCEFNVKFTILQNVGRAGETMQTRERECVSERGRGDSESGLCTRGQSFGR